MSKKIKIIIADNNSLMRRSLTAFLSDYEEFDVIGECANGRELLDMLKRIETDIVLLDLEMPVMSGFEALKIMQVRFRSVKAVVLSMHNDLRRIRECLSVGVCGYLSKDCVPEQLIQTLINVQLKGFYIEDDIYKNLLQNFANDSLDKQKLSRRENEILKELHDGKTEKEIAGLLNISRGTVHFHRMNIYNKTNTHNLAELLKYIHHNNLI
ncbi:DNA-binding response regulator [Sphingobacteriaceae bacterium]|nr:DNA-binding response regulator [Sphingobacteriaceae bacterium]